MENINFSTYEFPSNENGEVIKQTLQDEEDLINYLYKLLNDSYIAKVKLTNNAIMVKFDDGCFQISVEG